MALKQIPKITNNEIRTHGVSALADRPNLVASYGQGGLSPAELKAWFDQLAKKLAEKINLLIDVLGGVDAADYLRLDLKGLKPGEVEGVVYSLQDLCDSFLDGSFAKYLLAYPSAAEAELTSLQEVLNGIAEKISKTNEDLTNHNTDPAAHSAAMAKKVGFTDLMPVFEGEDVENTAKAPSAAALNGVLKQINSSIEGVDGKTELLLSEIGYDADTGVLTITRQNGTVYSYDLPSEKILKSGASYYDAESRKMHLVLMDDTDIEIDVSALVDEYYGDDETIVLTNAEGKKQFRIKGEYKATLDEYGEAISRHEKDIASLGEDKLSVSDVVDNVLSDAADKPVSARQAKLLHEDISQLQGSALNAYCGSNYDRGTNTLELVKTDGTKDTISFPLESFVSDAEFDAETNIVTLTVSNGKSVSFDLSALIDYYYGDGETIEVYEDPDDGFRHKIRVKATFLDGVNTEIGALEGKLSVLKGDVEKLGVLDKFGSIGKADGETITMEEDTGELSARKLKLADGGIFEIVETTRAAYDELSEKSATALYLASDGDHFDVYLGANSLFSGGVRDTETKAPITFRVLTKSAYDGLAERDAAKLYIIDNGGRLAFAFGNWYLDTDSALLNSLSTRVDALEKRPTYTAGDGVQVTDGRISLKPSSQTELGGVKIWREGNTLYIE